MDEKGKKLRNLMNCNLQLTETIVAMAEEQGITNDQDYIDYEIALCNLSTKDHNKL